MRSLLDDFDDIRLRELVLFDRLAELGTLTAAARELQVPKPTASRWLAALEARIGVTLVVRGARRAGLTEQGRAFRQQLQPVLVGVRALRAAGRARQAGGTLRVSVPVVACRPFAWRCSCRTSGSIWRATASTWRSGRGRCPTRRGWRVASRTSRSGSTLGPT